MGTVLKILQLAGAPKLVSERFARVLGLDPSMDTARLSKGQVQVLSLARALMRNPDVLVAIHPLGFIPSHRRSQMWQLLRAWQAGGVQRIIQLLAEDAEPRPNAV